MAFELVRTPEFQAFFAEMRDIKRPDLWALKVQVYLEYRLKQLLLLRLGILPDDEPTLVDGLGTLAYRHLLLLSLAGSRFAKLRRHLEKLNNVRIQVAHKFQTIQHTEPLRQFVTSVVSNEPWPVDDDEQLTSAQVALAMVMVQVELGFKEFEKAP